MYIVTFVILLVPSSARSKLYICPAQVASQGPTRDVVPLTMIQDGVYVSGELWKYWRDAFTRCSVHDMFDFVLREIDDERAKFTKSLAWRGPHSPT